MFKINYHICTKYHSLQVTSKKSHIKTFFYSVAKKPLLLQYFVSKTGSQFSASKLYNDIQAYTASSNSYRPFHHFKIISSMKYYIIFLGLIHRCIMGIV